MNNLSDLLDEYVEAHTAFGVPFIKAAPVSDQEISEAERLLGTSIPDPVLELWRWSNGSGIVPALGHRQPALFPNSMHFWPLLKSAELAVGVRDEILHGEYDERERIAAKFAPFPAIMMADSFETLEAVVSLEESDAGSVWLWVSYGFGCRRCFDSIEDFVRLQLSFYEVGAVRVPPYPHPDPGYPLPEVNADLAMQRVDVPDPWKISWQVNAWDNDEGGST